MRRRTRGVPKLQKSSYHLLVPIPTTKQEYKSLARPPPHLPPQPALSTRPERITFTDLRFFHHFLTVAYPHLPAGNDSIWVMEIPKIAEHKDCRMHAMLGLAASHLYRVDPQPRYNAAAATHRGHAIAGLNKAIATSVLKQTDADVMLATAYSLTPQA
jgi:Fungal specific transcription factor domain